MSNALGLFACFACLACASLDLGCAPRVQATQLTSAEISVRARRGGRRRATWREGGARARARESRGRDGAGEPVGALRPRGCAPGARSIRRGGGGLPRRRAALCRSGLEGEIDRDLRPRARTERRGTVRGGACGVQGVRGLRSRARSTCRRPGARVRAALPRDTLCSAAIASASNVASTLIGGDYTGRARARRQGAGDAEPSPWLEYNRGVALAELGRTDEAIAAFAAAERSFGTDDMSRHGRAVAIYGRARALKKAGRCPEARRACDEYARFTGSDPGPCRRC